MRGGLIAVVCLAALLCGCGKKSEQAFNDKFDENFRSSCIASATRSGVSTELASRLCGCAITEINKKYSAREKLAMSNDQANPIMAECLSKTTQR
jgi:hypothetical protein